ncbi:MAG: histidine phosphatase family protein [Candidatus Scalindua sp.]
MGKVILLRHAKAQKNIEDRHGGSGTNLIAEGKSQASTVVKKLIDYGFVPDKIYCSPVPQAVETATIAGSILNREVTEHHLLKPLNIGVLSGLSRHEAMRDFPNAARLMEEWRKGSIELHELVLPEAENYHKFYKRGNDFLKSQIFDNSSNCLVVGTRSILICLISILLNRTLEPGGGYREIPIECCDFFTFVREFDCFEFDSSKSNFKTSEI